MKKLTAASVTLISATLISAPVSAHDINSDACDVNLETGMYINHEVIEFTKNDKVLYKIVGENTLVVSGEEVSLAAHQEALVADYADSIRAVVPEVKGIAIEGIALATEGVNLAFNGLLGEGNNLANNLTQELNKLGSELDTRLSLESGIRFDENGAIGEDFLGEDFEERVEDTIESAIQDSIGSLLIAVGQEMLFAGGDMEALETRMENFGADIEQQMEARAELLEAKADALCQSIVVIDELEAQMRDEISELADFDLLEVSAHHNNKI